MEPDELVQLCEDYLRERRSTLWGRSYDIINPPTLREAAEWLAFQIEAVARYQDEKGGP